VRHYLFPEVRIRFRNIGNGCGFAEIGCVGGGFNQSHLDFECFDLLRQRLVQRFHSPLRGAVEADERQRRNSKTAGDAQDMAAALLAQ
jgi:hypothetical protein